MPNKHILDQEVKRLELVVQKQKAKLDKTKLKLSAARERASA